jgi:hypothetical protein
MSRSTSLAESFLVPDLLVLLGRVLLKEFEVPSDPLVLAKPPDPTAIMRYFCMVSKQLSALLDRGVTPNERFFLSSRTARTSAYLPLAVHNLRWRCLYMGVSRHREEKEFLDRLAQGSTYPEISVVAKSTWAVFARDLVHVLGELMPRNTVAFAPNEPEDCGPWLRYSTPVMPLIIFDKPPSNPRSTYFQRRDFYSILPMSE